MRELKRIVFMGTPDFAEGILEALIDDPRLEVTGVITQPDKPVGRKGTLTPPPVKVKALENGIPVFQPVKMRTEETIGLVRDLKPDAIVVAAYGKIIPQAILDIPPCGCLNVHASLLPAYRGAAPIQWAILEGEEVTGVTVMRMNAGLDTGDMILKEETVIAPDETGGSLFDKLCESGAHAIIRALDLIREEKAVYEPQPEESPTPYAAMLSRKDGLIDWSLEAKQIERKVRALDPWPGTYTYFGEKQLKILSAEVIGETGKDPEPGTVIRAGKEGIDIAAGDGALRALTVQLEGKKRMNAADFLRGASLNEGTLLGGLKKEEI